MPLRSASRASSAHSLTPYTPQSRQPYPGDLKDWKKRLVELHRRELGLCPCQEIDELDTLMHVLD